MGEVERFAALEKKGPCPTCTTRPRAPRQTYCRPCANTYLKGWKRANPESARRSRLRAKYSMTLEDFDALVQAQDGGCWICLLPLGDDAVVDHDHTNDAVRGIAHASCNQRLIERIEDPENLRRIADWIERVRS